MRRLFLVSLAMLAGSSALAAAPSPRLSNERVLLRTSRGDLVIAFYPDIAPKHTAQILKLVRLGVYDSTYFYRVEPNFVAQLTDAQNRKQPLSSEQLAAISKLPAEFSSVPHKPGLLSMARQDGDVNSAETSFSFMLGSAPHLDGKYTVFGQVEFGGPLLFMLAREPRTDRNAPVDPPVVESATVLTVQDYMRMRMAGELRQPTPIAASAVAAAATAAPKNGPSQGLNHAVMAGVGIMILCNLIVFLFGARWSPKTQGAINIMSVLVGVFILVSQYGGMPKRSPVVAMALFFGMVGLFKLVNRFESTAPPRPAERKS